MSIIPTPEGARELRSLFSGNPIVALALAFLAAAGVDHVRDALELLPTWEHFAQLSDREQAAVLAAYVPEPADTCERCGRAVRYVTDGADPGWWTHTDIEALLDGTAGHPHTAIVGGAA